MAMFPRTLIWLICFALFCFMPGCGGSGSGGGEGEELTYSLTITTTPDVDTFQAGETVTIIATVTGSDGLAASGYAVTFTIFRNNSGGTLTIADTGTTDGDGRAQATYTLGSDDSAEAVTDTIEVSIPGSSETITINRAAQTYSLVVSADETNLAAGEIATLTATITDGNGDPVSGQAVSFVISTNNSSGAIAISGTGTTDANGQATANFTAGAANPTEQLQDTITVSALGATQSITITRVIGTSEEADSLDLSASPTSIKTDNSNISTITVNALTEGNAILSGVTVNLSTDTGVLSAPSVTTPGTVTLSCGGTNKANRTATITATTGTLSPQQIPVQITGSTVTLASGSSSISTSGSTTLTVTAKDAGSNLVPGTAVTLTQSGTGTVTFGSASGTTNAGGVFSTTVTGNTNGTVTITATALGASASTTITVTDAATVFYIDRQQFCTGYPGTCTLVPLNPNPSAMQIGDILELRVNAPGTIANVVFATSTGTFHNAGDTSSGSVLSIPVVGGKATAYLTTDSAGLATVNVYNATNSSTNDTLSVAMTSPSVNAATITLQASPVVVPKSVGSTTGSSTLIAMVRDTNGQPVGNAPVMFSIVNPTGGGETISPVVVMTAATTTDDLNLGEARASFTSGSLPSGAPGVQIRASVVDTPITIYTGESTDKNGDGIITPPSAGSGNDASIVIGGVAGSVAFGQATALGVDDTAANYTLQMSVLVADANGNPAPEGTIVNLSLWPIAWSTGSSCSYDADGFSWNPVTEAYDIICPTCGTFWNEDINENLILDAGEDGRRHYYASSLDVGPGTIDGYITAVNSRAGTVPATVTTDENGVAGFTLTYPKTSSIWTIVRVRASTIVQGTETVGEVSFRLAPLATDVTPTCKIEGSPYDF